MHIHCTYLQIHRNKIKTNWRPLWSFFVLDHVFCLKVLLPCMCVCCGVCVRVRVHVDFTVLWYMFQGQRWKSLPYSCQLSYNEVWRQCACSGGGASSSLKPSRRYLPSQTLLPRGLSSSWFQSQSDWLPRLSTTPSQPTTQTMHMWDLPLSPRVWVLWAWSLLCFPWKIISLQKILKQHLLFCYF